MLLQLSKAFGEFVAGLNATVHLTVESGCCGTAARLSDLTSNIRNIHSVTLSGFATSSIDTLTDKTIAGVRQMLTGLKHLAVIDCDLECKHVKDLLTPMNNAVHLESLNLSHNNLGIDALKTLAKLLRATERLQSLDISINSGMAPKDYGDSANNDHSGVDAFSDSLSVNRTLRVLELSNTHFQFEAVDKLCKGLSKNCSVTRLGLANGYIDEHGATSLAEVIKQHPTIAYVDLSTNQVYDDGVVALCVALKESSSMRLLDLDSNLCMFNEQEFVDELTQAVSSSEATNDNDYETDESDSDNNNNSDNDNSDNDNDNDNNSDNDNDNHSDNDNDNDNDNNSDDDDSDDSDSELQPAINTSNLPAVNLLYNEGDMMLESGDIATAAATGGVVSNFCGVQSTDTVLRVCDGSSMQPSITYMCSVAAMSCRNLTTLSINDGKSFPFTVCRVRHALSNAPHIHTLELVNCMICADEAKDVAKLIERVDTITCLNLSDNGLACNDVWRDNILMADSDNDDIFGDSDDNDNSSSDIDDECRDSTGFVRIGAALRKNNSITSLNLSGNHINDEAIAYVLDGISDAVTHLDISNNNVTITSRRNLTKVISTTTTLTSLNLLNNKLTSTNMSTLIRPFTSNTTLTTLTGRKTYTPSIYELPKELVFADVVLITAEISSDTSVTSVVPKLYSKRKLVQRVLPIDNEVASAVAKMLSITSSLCTLDLSECKLSECSSTSQSYDTFGESLGGSQTITTLKLRGTGADNSFACSFAVPLMHNTVLTDLDLFDNRISDDGAEGLVEALSDNATLQSINLMMNSFKIEAAKSLSEVLTTNDTLESLCGNVFKRTGCFTMDKLFDESQQSVVLLAGDIRNNVQLTELSFKDVTLYSHAMTALGNALCSNTVLRSLSFTASRIFRFGGNALADVLRVNTTLHTLRLIESCVAGGNLNNMFQAHVVGSGSQHGVVAIAESLCVNTTIRKLAIVSDGVSEESVTAIANMLKCNTTLECLDLSGSYMFNDVCADVLSDVLIESNTTITSLFVADCLNPTKWNKLKSSRHDITVHTEYQCGCQLGQIVTRTRGIDLSDMM